MAAAVERWAQAHRSELIEDLKGLIRIRSVVRYGEKNLPLGSDCKEALIYMQSLAQRYGFDFQNGDWFYTSILQPGSTGKHELGILGHADVVPEGPGWKYDPFAPVEKNGYLIGRGAIDNKGPVIMALYVMRAFRELGIHLSGNLRLIIGCDEENEMRDINHYLTEHEPPAFTLNVDGKWPVCIGEKGIMNADLLLRWKGDTLLEISGGDAANSVPAYAQAVLHKSCSDQFQALKAACLTENLYDMDDRFIIKAIGKSAHASSPASGSNAIRSLLKILATANVLSPEETQLIKRLLSALRDDYGTGLQINHADKLSGPASCVPTQIQMSSGCIKVHLNIRYAVTQTGNFLLKKMHSACQQLGLQLENISDSPARLNSVDQPEISLLMDTCHEFVSRRCHPYITAGGTHSRIFPHSVPFGPVSPEWMHRSSFGGPHAANEAVLIDDLLLGIKVYAAALVRLDRYYSHL